MFMSNSAIFSLFKSDAQKLINKGIPLMAGSGSGIAYNDKTGQNEYTGIYFLNNYTPSQLSEVVTNVATDPTSPYIPLFMTGVKYSCASGSLHFNSGSNGVHY
jgi:hypothetical protein